MITPRYLKKGDKIGIVAPAKYIPQDKYDPIINYIKNRGYEIIRGQSTFLEYGPFAGTDEERKYDLQQMLDNPEIRAIFCLRGGYGTIRIIKYLDFTKFLANPKWLVGFSDITILHSHLTNLKVESLHGQMPINFVNIDSKKGVDKLFDTLTGNFLKYQINTTAFNISGGGSGTLTGGNLAILCSLIGTPFDIDTDNKILFIEEVGEYLYRFDRLMHQLKLSGKLDNLAGLIIGGLTNMEDNDPKFPITENGIVYHLIKDSHFPVCFNFPAGHTIDNFPIIMGRKITLSVNETRSKIEFEDESA